MFNIGNLELKNAPAHKLADYTKLIRNDREGLQLNFNVLYTWNCVPNASNGEFPTTLTLNPIFRVTRMTESGSRDETESANRLNRFLAEAALNAEDFDQALQRLFPPRRFDIPQNEITRVFGPYFKVVVGYWRYDTHHLLTANPNPREDWAMLSLPSWVQFAAYAIDTFREIGDDHDPSHNPRDVPFEIMLKNWIDPEGEGGIPDPLDPFWNPELPNGENMPLWAWYRPFRYLWEPMDHYWKTSQPNTDKWRELRKDDFTDNPEHPEYDEQHSANGYRAHMRWKSHKDLLRSWKEDLEGGN